MDKNNIPNLNMESKNNDLLSASQLKNLRNDYSSKIIDHLSSSRESLKWKKWIIIEEHWDSGLLAKAILKKDWIDTTILHAKDLVEDVIDNQNIDFVIFSPRFKLDWSHTLLEEDLNFLNFIHSVHKDIPIIAYTSRVMRWEIEMLKSLPFADIIEKPTNPNKFRDIVQKTLIPDLYKTEDILLLEQNKN